LGLINEFRQADRFLCEEGDIEILPRPGETQYPEPLTPDSEEIVRLPSGDEVRLPKTRPTFKRWIGEFTGDTYGNKPILDIDGKAMFAELAILKIFQMNGWDGVWVDNFRR
jgi:hypothetical protein